MRLCFVVFINWVSKPTHIFDIKGNFVTLKRNYDINTPTDPNCLNENCRYILIYVTNVYNYFHDFKKPEKYATIKIEILIENGQSLKLRQTRWVNTTSLLSTTSTQQNWPQTRLPSLSESCREDQEWVERGWEWVGRRGEVEGCQVSTTTTTSITISLTTIPTLSVPHSQLAWEGRL